MAYVTIRAEVLESLLQLNSLSRASSYSSETDPILSPGSPNSIVSETQSLHEALRYLPMVPNETSTHSWPVIAQQQFLWNSPVQTPLQQSQLADSLCVAPFFDVSHDKSIQQTDSPPQPTDQPMTAISTDAKKEERTARRRIQNRRSQRAFRDRKDAQAKELEAAVARLMEEYRVLEEENVRLKAEMRDVMEEQEKLADGEGGSNSRSPTAEEGGEGTARYTRQEE